MDFSCYVIKLELTLGYYSQTHSGWITSMASKSTQTTETNLCLWQCCSSWNISNLKYVFEMHVRFLYFCYLDNSSLYRSLYFVIEMQ